MLGQTLLAPAPSTHLPWARKEPIGNRWKPGRAAPGAAGTVTLGSRRRAGASGHYSLHEPGVSAVGCWHHPLRPGEGFEVRAAPLGRLERGNAPETAALPVVIQMGRLRQRGTGTCSHRIGSRTLSPGTAPCSVPQVFHHTPSLIRSALVPGVLLCCAGAANLVGSFWLRGCVSVVPPGIHCASRSSHHPFLLGLENSLPHLLGARS